MKINLSQKIATIISAVFNPVVLALLILVASVYKSSIPTNIAYYWYGAILLLNIFIPGLVYIFFTKKGYIFDDELKNEKVTRERILLFSIFLFVTIVEILVVRISGYVYQPLYAVLVGGAISLVIASVISYFWKISMHASGITMFVLMFVIIFGIKLWPLMVLIGLVWWARLVLKRHNIWQLVAGSVLSFIIVYFVFAYYDLIYLI